MPPRGTLSSRWLGRAFNLERRRPAASELPLYLCPAFRSISGGRMTGHFPRRPPLQPAQFRRLYAGSAAPSPTEPQPEVKQPIRTLPFQCPGCGALSQTSVPDAAGHYDLSRRILQEYLGLVETSKRRRSGESQDNDEVVQRALQSIDVDALKAQGINLEGLLPAEPAEASPPPQEATAPTPPVCDRCHNLIHHSTGTSIFHPSVESLRDTIEESPFKHSHVYHVLDAADFPMSLLPRLSSLLDITLRTQNRRSKPVNYSRGRLIEMSFVITRSDLLAPRKEQVDALMPYLTEVLRDALGRLGGRVRLGNVHCVSAKASWWTRELKENIWKRGGAGWLVGKANVGKSRLFEAIYPKGRMKEVAPKREISVNVFPAGHGLPDPGSVVKNGGAGTVDPGANTEPDAGAPNPFLSTPPDPSAADYTLLPPAQPEANYPVMPVVSSLPGTTASPIRIPYGSGRGELIDLPGLVRSDLENHVKESHRSNLLLSSRFVPAQHSLKPGKSLLIGGFIRLTPRNLAADGDHELVFLAYAFTPIQAHLTATEKAIAVQTQAEDAPAVGNISLPGTGATIKHAGAFQIRYDITKARTGPLTRKNAINLKVESLPYRVLGLDILIEGCGWVELVVQVRTRQLRSPKEEEKPQDPWAAFEAQVLGSPPPKPAPKSKAKTPKATAKPTEPEEEELNWPVIDVYTPEGRFIGWRKPMNAYMLCKPKGPDTKRPRKSMKGVKKEMKRMKREKEKASGM
ncbi:uncharacterized protein C8A04DRAFT_16099 [Dichotomopilus funicola]|uniref:Genetic interactor of prohibitins 3, mitochondrial n=1 Tax=Dichotomopilus funicola TaxID=1934379 RepID=A0AAN6UUC2_9PEZI|nr:hypothetical protein C8A04DRAFT_16099 [Dichotomopilus funicola]